MPRSVEPCPEPRTAASRELLGDVRLLEDRSEQAEEAVREYLPAIEAQAAELATAMTARLAKSLAEVLPIAEISYEGDSWFVRDAGIEYEEAERRMAAARALLAELDAPKP